MNASSGIPLVSIVTPSYNQAAYLEATIQSVLSQDYPRIEYLVVDGGSTDGSAAVIERYAHRLAWWVSEKDRGQTHAINKGFASSSGEIMAWLNSDDTFEPGTVSQAVEYFAAHPEARFIYGEANYIDRAGRVVGRFQARQTDFRRLMQGYVHIPQQATFWRRDLWDQVGPLDENLHFAMDYDLWVRAARLTPLVYLPGRVWANFRLHDDSKSIATDGYIWKDMLGIHRRQGGSLFSVLRARYLVRTLLSPYIRWKRARMFRR